MTERCMCGDTDCPSCGLAQGTYEPYRRAVDESEIADNINETLKDIFQETARFGASLKNDFDRETERLNRDGGDTRAAMAVSRVAIETDRDWEKEKIKREFRK